LRGADHEFEIRIWQLTALSKLGIPETFPRIFNCFKYHEIWFAGYIKGADHEFEIRIWRLTALSKLGIPETMQGIFNCFKYYEILFPG
jgi:hypothetical protein